MYVNNITPVAYGHLDFDGQKIWLGVCVSDKYHGTGLGKAMVNELINFSKKNSVEEINLSVDKENVAAFSLYQKTGFTVIGENNGSYFMKRGGDEL